MSQKCYEYGLRRLAQRNYSRHKLSKSMERKGFKASHREQALNALIEKNYLQEKLYWQGRVRTLMNRKESPELIQKKLKEEKISLSLEEIKEVFRENNISPQGQIHDLIQKKIPPSWPTDPHQSQRVEAKILRYLISRGHELQQGKTALMQIRQDQGI